MIPFDGTNGKEANGFGFVTPSPSDLYLATWLGMLNYLPLTDETLKLAAQLWAQTRAEGKLRCPDGGLDIDIILAAQARQRLVH